MRAEPGFDEAARICAANVIGLYRDSGLLNLVINDQGRVVIGWFAIYLNLSGGEGLTLSRIIALCKRHRVCSAGRAAAIVGLMRATGYLAPVPSGDRRERRLAPTERLMNGQWERWRCVLAALAHLRPAARRSLAAMGDPAFDRSLVSDLFDHYLAGFRLIGANVTELSLIGQRKAGIVILFSLFAARRPGERGEQVADLSVSELARRFHVSRAHVISVLRDAQEQGLLHRGRMEGDPVVVLPPLVEGVGKFLASSFLLMDHCSRRALDAATR
ncbi:hypothetical protein [Brevundimonas sp.]|uniref:hypothetical protein n=1 Tax=Brevundimonas sp. TaxID=1871086 RepID=UPI002CB0CD7B|nr:hypothetical protein [Brevundimonas sp.]HWQ86596.1 hypothetical protein [Brevundimonas sp.]